MYSAVYKCVCRQYSERLYCDLMSSVDAAFADMAFNIEAALRQGGRFTLIRISLIFLTVTCLG
jgi:hypothetical protein